MASRLTRRSAMARDTRKRFESFLSCCSVATAMQTRMLPTMDSRMSRKRKRPRRRVKGLGITQFRQRLSCSCEEKESDMSSSLANSELSTSSNRSMSRSLLAWSGQTHSPASGDHYFSLLVCLVLRDFGKWRRRDGWTCGKIVITTGHDCGPAE